MPIRSKRDGLALMAWTLIARETGEDWGELQAWTWGAFATALRAGTAPSPDVGDALRAHALVESGKARGKIVLEGF